MKLAIVWQEAPCSLMDRISDKSATSILKRVKLEAAGLFFYQIIRRHISEGSNILYLLLLESRI
jgi:hypothetical protein